MRPGHLKTISLVLSVFILSILTVDQWRSLWYSSSEERQLYWETREWSVIGIFN